MIILKDNYIMNTNSKLLFPIKKVYGKLERYCRQKRLDKLKKYFKAERVELLQKYSRALNDAGVVFWLEFGTLLGYYREGDFIAHDCDMDTGTYLENAERVYKALTAAGFELVREYHVTDDGGLEQCYQYMHTTIDVFYFRKEGDKLYCNSFYPMLNMSRRKYRNKKCPFQVKKIEVPDTGYEKATFKGCEVYVPKDCERYLITHYGPSYRTPNPNYNWRKDSTNIILYPYNDKPGYGILKSLYI